MDEKIYDILARIIEKAAINPKNILDDLKGEDGKNGAGIKRIRINKNYELIIKLDDGNIINAGKLPQGEKGESIKGDPGEPGISIKGDPGEPGVAGKDGKYVTEININADSNLIFTMSDGEQIFVKMPESKTGPARRWGGGGTTKVYVDTAIADAIAGVAVDFVPYTGAIQSLDMGIYNITATGLTGANIALTTGAAIGHIPKSDGSGNLTWTAPTALTRNNDTNVTLTLGGSATTALVNAASITVGWTGTLAETRGGTGTGTYTLGDILYSSASNILSKLSGNITTTKKFLNQTGNGTISASPVWSAISGADITGAELTKTDDTNVTLTLGGSPTAALLNAASLTLGWAGTLAAARLNSNVVQAITNDTNVTGSISAQNLTLGWTGQLAVSRGGTGASSFTAASIPFSNGTVLTQDNTNFFYTDGTDTLSIANVAVTGKFITQASLYSKYVAALTSQAVNKYAFPITKANNWVAFTIKVTLQSVAPLSSGDAYAYWEGRMIEFNSNIDPSIVTYSKFGTSKIAVYYTASSGTAGTIDVYADPQDGSAETTLSSVTVEIISNTAFTISAPTITTPGSITENTAYQTTYYTDLAGTYNYSAGSATAPSISFTGDTNTGIYRIGADNIGITAGGVKQVDITTAGATFSGTLTNAGIATLGTSTNRLTVATSTGAGEKGLWISYGITIANTVTIQAEHQGTAYRDILLNPYGANVVIGNRASSAKFHVYTSAAGEPLAYFESGGDTSIRVYGPGGESYMEFQNNATTTSNAWKIGVNDSVNFEMSYGTAGTANSSVTTMYVDASTGFTRFGALAVAKSLVELYSNSTPTLSITNSGYKGSNRLSNVDFYSGGDAGERTTPIARISAIETYATTGSYTGELIFYTATTSALAEAMRITHGGTVAIGTATAVARTQLTLAPAASTISYMVSTSGTLTSTSDGASTGVQCGWFNTNTFNPSTGASLVYQIYISGIFKAPSAQTITDSHGIYIYNDPSANVGTLTNVYGIRIVAGGSAAGTVTNHYALHVTKPAGGTNKYTAYFDAGVGIAIVNAGGTHALLVTGTAGLSTGTAWTNTSDKRIKRNIIDIKDALPLIEKLQPRRFRYIDEYLNIHKLADKEYYGFIADEVEKIIPSCIINSTESLGEIHNLKQLDIHNINILLIKAVQTLSDKITILENSINR